MDIGFNHNTGQVEEICQALKINGGDITLYEYVDLSLRAASLALAQKILKAHSRSAAKGKALS